MSSIKTRSAVALLATAALSAACYEQFVGPVGSDTRLAVTTWIASKPAFILQTLDGRDTLRFHFESLADDIAGNASAFTLTDDNLAIVSSPRWNPVGNSIAVRTGTSFDQSEIVVFDLAGGKPLVVSPNTQMIGSIDWLPGGSAIGYTMGTASSGFDLFSTDLGTHEVKRLTTAGNLSGSVVRWNVTGSAVRYSQRVGDAKDAGANWISQIARVTLSSNVVDTIRTSIVGQVVDISRSGRALVFRRSFQGVDIWAGDLILLDLADGAETSLITHEMILEAHFSPEDERAIVRVAKGPGGSDIVFDIIELATKDRARIAGVGGNATAVDVNPRWTRID